MLGKRFQQQGKHETCTITLFYHKILGGQKILCPPVHKLRTCPPIPHALDVYLDTKGEFPITTFYSIAEILEIQIKKLERNTLYVI